jgi:hypothetical protein
MRVFGHPARAKAEVDVAGVEVVQSTRTLKMALFILWASVQSTLAVSSYKPFGKQTSPASSQRLEDEALIDL